MHDILSCNIYICTYSTHQECRTVHWHWREQIIEQIWHHSTHTKKRAWSRLLWTVSFVYERERTNSSSWPLLCRELWARTSTSGMFCRTESHNLSINPHLKSNALQPCNGIARRWFARTQRWAVSCVWSHWCNNAVSVPLCLSLSVLFPCAQICTQFTQVDGHTETTAKCHNKFAKCDTINAAAVLPNNGDATARASCCCVFLLTSRLTLFCYVLSLLLLGPVIKHTTNITNTRIVGLEVWEFDHNGTTIRIRCSQVVFLWYTYNILFRQQSNA